MTLEMKVNGPKIRKLRKRFSSNIEDFAKKHGIAKSNLQDMESGKANPTLKTLSKIAALLDVKRPKDLIIYVNRDEKGEH